MTTKVEVINQLIVTLVDRGLLAVIAGAAGFWLAKRLEKYKRGQQTAAELAKVRVQAFIEVFSTMAHVHHLVATFLRDAAAADKAETSDERARLGREADESDHAIGERLRASPDMDKRTSFLIGKHLHFLAFKWFDALRDAMTAIRAHHFDSALELMTVSDSLWDEVERYMPPLEAQQPAPKSIRRAKKDSPPATNDAEAA